MQAMDVLESDINVVFSILDEDKNGTVSPQEFATELFKMKSQEAHTILVFLKHYALDIREKVTLQLKLMREDLLLMKSKESFLWSNVRTENEEMLQSLSGNEVRGASAPGVGIDNAGATNRDSANGAAGKEVCV